MRFWRAWLWALMGLIHSVETPASGSESRPDDEITKLAENVYLFRHQFRPSIFLITPEGTIVTDPITPEAAAWLKREIAKLTDRPVRYVVYSHHHNDHIAGGRVFADTARFVSHRNARQALVNEPDPQIPLPEITFTDRMSLDLGGTHVELIYTGKNHSDNSLVVLLPQHRLLFAVDFIPVQTVAYRTMRSDYPDEWIDSLKLVEQLEFDTLVPGHGQIGRKEHVRMFRGYLEDLRAAVREAVKNGLGLEDTKKSVRLPQYEQWQRYAEWFPENVEGMYRYVTAQQKAKQ